MSDKKVRTRPPLMVENLRGLTDDKYQQTALQIKKLMVPILNGSFRNEVEKAAKEGFTAIQLEISVNDDTSYIVKTMIEKALQELTWVNGCISSFSYGTLSINWMGEDVSPRQKVLYLGVITVADEPVMIELTEHPVKSEDSSTSVWTTDYASGYKYGMGQH